jgi:hypothetical protein
MHRHVYIYAYMYTWALNALPRTVKKLRIFAPEYLCTYVYTHIFVYMHMHIFIIHVYIDISILTHQFINHLALQCDQILTSNKGLSINTYIYIYIHTQKCMFIYMDTGIYINIFTYHTYEYNYSHTCSHSMIKSV